MLNEFKYNRANECIYSKFTKDYGVIIYLYINDMLIFSTNMMGINETKRYQTFVFKTKDLDEVDTIWESKLRNKAMVLYLIKAIVFRN